MTNGDRVCRVRLLSPFCRRYLCFLVLSIPIGTRTHTGEQMLAKIETRIDEPRDFHSLRIEQWREFFSRASCVLNCFFCIKSIAIFRVLLTEIMLLK